MKTYLTLDVGGSAIKYALMQEDLTILEKSSVPTPMDTLENFIETIGKIYDQFQDQIDGINGGVVTGSVVTVESVLNYWKNQVATQEKSVEEAKQKVTAAEKSIELFNKGEYKEAYVIEQKKLALETAQEAYDVAKAIYDTALAQVKSVLETLSK